MTNEVATLRGHRNDLLAKLHSLRVQRMRIAGRVLANVQRAPIEAEIAQAQKELSQVNRQLMSLEGAPR